MQHQGVTLAQITQIFKSQVDAHAHHLVYCCLLVSAVLSVQPAFTATFGEQEEEEEEEEEEEVSCQSQQTTLWLYYNWRLSEVVAKQELAANFGH
jgi:hypothetical protein